MSINFKFFILPMSLFTLYIDGIMYPDFNEVSGYSSEDVATITTQKEELEKYDPTFIPRIIEMEKMLTLPLGHSL